jgi:hypothetical protein
MASKSRYQTRNNFEGRSTLFYSANSYKLIGDGISNCMRFYICETTL